MACGCLEAFIAAFWQFLALENFQPIPLHFKYLRVSLLVREWTFFYLFDNLKSNFSSKTSALGERFTGQSDRKIRHLTFSVCMIMQKGVCICSREEKLQIILEGKSMSIPVIKWSVHHWTIRSIRFQEIFLGEHLKQWMLTCDKRPIHIFKFSNISSHSLGNKIKVLLVAGSTVASWIFCSWQ